MTRLVPLEIDDVPGGEAAFGAVSQVLGFVPNSLRIMARKPDLMKAFQGLVSEVFKPGKVSPELRALVAHVVSRSAGCRYCSAHTAHIAKHRNVAEEKLAAVWEYETNPLFDEAERVALRVAQAAGTVPNMVSDEDFVELRRHFDEEEIVEIVALISMYGFFNRWNDTFKTELEDTPAAVAEKLFPKGVRPEGW